VFKGQGVVMMVEMEGAYYHVILRTSDMMFPAIETTGKTATF